MADPTGQRFEYPLNFTILVSKIVGSLQITIAVQSGKTYSFRIGEFKGEYTKTREGNRDFTLKSTIDPTMKITFRETLLQMPEKWWDELEEKLGASESGLSKVLHGVYDTLKKLS